jgi:hypothetical protein
MFKFSIDGHKMKVIAMDWVPIEPYNADVIFIAIGQVPPLPPSLLLSPFTPVLTYQLQRYEVIVEANAVPGNYWMRSVPQLTCLNLNSQQYNIRGIIRYDSTSTTDPTSQSWNIQDQCADEDSKNLVPHVVENVGEPEEGKKGFEVGLAPVIGEKGKPFLAFHWTVNSNHYRPNTSAPTTLLIGEDVNSNIPKGYSVTELNFENKVCLVCTVTTVALY